MTDLKDQFLSARDYVQNKQYDDARRILNQIDHPKAKEWLANIDELDPPKVQNDHFIKRLIKFVGHKIAQLKNRPIDEANHQPDEGDVVENGEDDSDLGSTDMVGSYLRYAQFQGADFRGRDLSGAYLFGANLSGANLIGANLTAAGLIGANLMGADLRGANLEGADLIGAKLEGADLEDADLTDVKLPDKTKWTPESDMSYFTDRDHPNFWQSFTDD
jgi:hypothetical protein